MMASLAKTFEVASASSTRADAIRRTAARLFEVSGYSATTMNDIADAVGVLPGSLYHHFRSKEEIAVDLLSSLGRSLDDLGEAACGRSGVAGAEAEAAVRRLAAELTTLSFRHAAAIRLRAHEAPPSVSTERFTEAMQFQAPALDRAWRNAVGSLATIPQAQSVDLGLLRFALQRLTLHAAVYYPTSMQPEAVANHLCDILLHGLVPDCPDDERLDSSAAFKAAMDTISGWRNRDRRTPLSDRETIVFAARVEFARRGYEATTIRDIATAAGVRMGTLYRRVESKEALLREIIDGYAVRFDQAFRAVMTEGSSIPESLDSLARVFVHISRRYREEARIVIYGWGQREAAASPFHDYFVATQQRLAQLEKLMKRGFGKGLLRPIADPPETALHLRSILWLPFHDHGRTSEVRAHGFLRQSLIRGALSPR